MPEQSSLGIEAQQTATSELLNPERPRANVVGFAYGNKYTNGVPTGDRALLVLVNRKLPEELLSPADRVPETIADLPTDVFAVGDLVAERSALLHAPSGATEAQVHHNGALFELERVALPAAPATAGPQLLTRRMRPCPAGFSIGNVAITAGTLSGVVYDFQPGASVNPPLPGVGIPARYYALSNNHVLAASNAAPIGSAVVQPGPFDGGMDPQDRIAMLSRFVPIQFFPQIPLPLQNNFVDCAVAECSFEDATREIYFNGAPSAWSPRASVQVGMRLRKTGRTTSMSLGTVIGLNATVDVNYGGGQVARFKDQIITSNMSAGGDSGSLVTDWQNNALGLLFAGSSVVTIVNHFEHVRAALRVEIAERIVDAVP